MMKQTGAAQHKFVLLLLQASAPPRLHNSGREPTREARAGAIGLDAILDDEHVELRDGGACFEHVVLLDEKLAMALVIVVGDGGAAGPDVLQTLCGGYDAEDGGHVLEGLAVLVLVALVLEETHGVAFWSGGGEDGDWGDEGIGVGGVGCRGGVVVDRNGRRQGEALRGR